MPASGLQVLYGPPGVGKSFLALDAALHVAAGRPWAGRKVRQGGVVYIASEGASGFRKRVLASIERKGFALDIPFALIETAPDLGRGGDRDALIDAIVEQCPFDPRLIVLDTLSRSIASMNESDTRDMNQFIGNAGFLSRRFSALVMPVHHTGKDMDRGMRGSSTLNGAADAVWFLKNERGTLSFGLEKMKDGDSGIQTPFTLVSQVLGDDEDGDPIETMVAEVSDQPLSAAPTPDQEESVLEHTVAMMRETLSRLSKPQAKTVKMRTPTLPAATPAMSFPQLRKLVIDKLQKEDPTYGSKRGAMAFGRAYKVLINAGEMIHSNEWVWLVSPEDVGAENAEIDFADKDLADESAEQALDCAA